jgi:cytoskeletal protein CcmA (bactofilin family)
VVGPGGWLKGTITCMDADIQGQLEGKINVTNTLAIQEKGDVRGEINYKQLQVALGGQLAGDLQSAVQADGESRSRYSGKPESLTASPDKSVLLDTNKQGSN